MREMNAIVITTKSDDKSLCDESDFKVFQMDKFLGRYSPYIYAILRIVAGLMFAMHGSQKLFGIPGNKPPLPVTSLLGVGGAIELITGLMIALGLLAGYAAFIASGEMAGNDQRRQAVARQLQVDCIPLLFSKPPTSAAPHSANH
ncbi:MAG TPA: DoxX family protein [Chroococcales cyanobacterium]